MNSSLGGPHRARLGLAALLGAVALTVGAKAATGGGDRSAAVVAAPAAAAPGVTGTAAPITPGVTPAPTDSAGASGPVSPSPGPASSPGSSTPAGSGSSGATASRRVTGDVVATRYGPVQVQLVLTGRKITDVVSLQLPDRTPHDIEISDQVVPILRQEVLDAQSARIDTISGASYTSDGYASSVQSALDRAGA